MQELNLRAKYGINVIAIRGENGQTNIAPGADDRLNPKDIIVAIGANKNLREMGWI